jgi:hypothetical protein
MSLVFRYSLFLFLALFPSSKLALIQTDSSERRNLRVNTYYIHFFSNDSHILKYVHLSYNLESL